MDTREQWSRSMIAAGGVAMLVGAVDPMEGSLITLVGSGVVALGAHLGGVERRLLSHIVWVFALVLFGVGALWGMTAIGGIGGTSGRSMGWGLLVVPYLVGWSLGIWRPGAPRWLLFLGIAVGTWYLAIPILALTRTVHSERILVSPLVIIGLTGLLTIGGCLYRFRTRSPGPAQGDSSGR
jgi:hypothetical protein